MQSRLNSILSGLFSPFRSSRKVQSTAPTLAGTLEAPPAPAMLDAVGADDEVRPDGYAPPSPSPVSRRLYPNLSQAALELDTPHQPLLTPRRPALLAPAAAAMDVSPPRQANALLAQFFAQQGERPLTEVEQAGVLQLMQQGEPRPGALRRC